MFDEFFSNEKLQKLKNLYYFVTLIPKVLNPQSLGNFIESHCWGGAFIN
jgi:hypothetical protein